MAKDKKKTGKIIPQNELKSARFIRVVTPRVAKAAKSIKVIGYCSASNYEYTPAQVKQIIDTLATALVNLESRFKEKVKSEDAFAFME